MRGKCGKTGAELVSYGYKYNTKKVLVFVTTLGAGSLVPGRPYQAKFNDIYHNVCYRDVARPQVLCMYFKHINVVDVHNQIRQHILALEEAWVTKDGYFRLFSTFVGFTVTDVFFLCVGKKGATDEKDEDSRRKIVEFTTDVAESLLDMADKVKYQNASAALGEPMVEYQRGDGPKTINFSGEGGSIVSPMSSITQRMEIKHTETYLCQRVQSLQQNGWRIPT